jgi:hypothetical protein
VTYYKILKDGKSCNGGSLAWSLPKQNDDGSWTPGDWHRVGGEPSMCSHGIHVVKNPYERWWACGCDVYIVETGPIVAEELDKALTMSCRLLSLEPKPTWLIETERFIASVKDVPFFKPDGHPREDWNLFTAPTGDAAWAAAKDAAWGAAWDAARDAAGPAAWDAARDAARDAAWDAAGYAAGDAAWDAARDAAGPAAWDAARGAALMARVLISELTGPHLEHARARWEVWQKGYGLLCDVNGKLYVYGVEPKAGEGEK